MHGFWFKKLGRLPVEEFGDLSAREPGFLQWFGATWLRAGGGGVTGGGEMDLVFGSLRCLGGL